MHEPGRYEDVTNQQVNLRNMTAAIMRGCVCVLRLLSSSASKRMTAKVANLDSFWN
jgi:hypothetical protein